MGGKPTLESIDAKIDTFMDSQKSVNENISNAISELAKTASKSDAMQVEMNGQTQRVTELSHTVKDMEKQLATHGTQLAVNKTIIKQQQDMKVMFTRAFIALGVAFTIAIGSQVFMNQGSSEVQKAMIKIAKGIK